MRICSVVALAWGLCGASACEKSAPEASGAQRRVRAAEQGARGGQDGKPSFTIDAEAPSSVAVGKEGSATVVVRPHAPYKINLEYPLRMTIAPPAGAKVGKTTLVAADARELSKQLIQLEPTFAVSRSGSHRFDAELHFSVCTDALCELKREKIHWTVSAP